MEANTGIAHFLLGVTIFWTRLLNYMYICYVCYANYKYNNFWSSFTLVLAYCGGVELIDFCSIVLRVRVP